MHAQQPALAHRAKATLAQFVLLDVVEVLEAIVGKFDGIIWDSYIFQMAQKPS